MPTTTAQAGKNLLSDSQRFLLLMANFGMTVYGLAISVDGAVLPAVIATFHLNKSEAGLMPAAGFLGFLFTVMGGGLLADQVGKGRVVLWGATGSFCALVMATLSPSYVVLLGVVTLAGATHGLIESGLNALAAEIDDDRPAVILNLNHVFFGLGAGLGPLMAGVILDSGFGWRAVYGTIGAIFALFLIAIVRRPLPAPPLATDDHDVTFRDLLGHPGILLSALVMFLYVGAETSLAAWISVFLGERWQMSPFAASAGLALFWGTIMVGRLGMSWLAGRVAAITLVRLCGVTGALACLALVLAPAPAWGYLAITAAGLTLAGTFPTSLAYATQLFPMRCGGVTGILVSSAGLGGMLLPWLVGVIADAAGLIWAMTLPGLGMAGVALAYLALPVKR